jgi:Metallopeptidase family M24
MFKEAEKGVAVPTCVTVNNLVQYYTPLASDAYTLKAGDVVKVELGAHIDGYIGTAAHTTVVSVDPSQPVTGKAADVIAAAYYAQEAVLRMMKPGTSVSILNCVWLGHTPNVLNLSCYSTVEHRHFPSRCGNCCLFPLQPSPRHILCSNEAICSSSKQGSR